MNYTGKAFDVSHYQAPDRIDWAAALADGYDLCIANASDGTTKDAAFLEHMQRAEAVGMKRGAYHYVYSDPSPEAQVAVFREQLTVAGPLDLPPVLDIEGKAHQLPKRAENARRMAEMLGDCIVYVNPNDWGILQGPRWMMAHPLWLAHYRAAGTAPPLGSWVHCMHQWTGTGRVPWYPGEIDLNAYDPGEMPWQIGTGKSEIVASLDRIQAELEKIKKCVAGLDV